MQVVNECERRGSDSFNDGIKRNRNPADCHSSGGESRCTHADAVLADSVTCRGLPGKVDPENRVVQLDICGSSVLMFNRSAVFWLRNLGPTSALGRFNMSSQSDPSDSDSADSAPADHGKGSRPTGKLILITVGCVCVLLLLAPTIIAKTGMRDRLINAAIKDESLSASTRSASFGYIAPLSVQGFELKADDGSLQVKMESLTCDKSWLSMLFSDGDLGNFRFQQPTVSIVSGIASTGDAESETEAGDDASADDAEPIKSLPTFVAEFTDAGVQLRNVSRKDPAIDLQGIDFTIRTEQQEFGSLVHIEPTTILDQQPLTPELCSQGLQLIAPMLADAVVVQGQLTFQLDHCKVPVGDLDKQQRQQLTDIGGALRLSDVSVGLNNEITAKILALLERFGATDKDVKLTVSRNSEVRFHVVEGRVHHEGLMFLLPIADSDFELTSSGSVGFDETLDLRLTLGLPKSLLGESALAKFLTSDPIVIQVTGVVDEPEIKLASDKDWNGRLTGVLEKLNLAGGPAEDGQDADAQADDPSGDAADRAKRITESAGAVLDVVGGLLERDENQERSPLFNRRERRADRDEESSEEPRPRLFRRRRAEE